MSDKQTTQSEPRNNLTADPRLARPEAPPPLVRTTRLVTWAGLALLFIALAWWGIARRLTLPPIILAALGVLGVVAWIILNLPALRQTAGTRSAKLIFNSAAFSLFVLGILVCVNVIAIRHHPRVDLTKDKLFSLSPQTASVVSDLKQDVRFIAFLPQDAGGADKARETVRLYQTLSPRIRVEWADYTDVAKAKQYEVTFPGTVVVEAGVKKEKVTDVSEQRLTSAIMSVTTDTKIKLYFLTGHGEPSLAGGENSLAGLKESLTNQQYDVAELDLAKLPQPAVPGDCNVLAVIGPRVQLTKEEMAAITAFVDNRGKLLLALAQEPAAPTFADILSRRGVTVLNGVVMDPRSAYLGQPHAPMVQAKEGTPLAEGLGRLVLPLSRGLKVESQAPPPQYPGMPPAQPSGPAQTLVESSPDSWIQPDLKAGLARPANAQSGSFALAAFIDESPAPPPSMPGQPPAPQEQSDATRIVVLGSAMAFTDTLTRSFEFNTNLALNSVAWLSKNTRLISIPPKRETPHNLLLTNTQKNFIIFVVMFFIPIAVIAAGIAVWWARRR